MQHSVIGGARRLSRAFFSLLMLIFCTSPIAAGAQFLEAQIVGYDGADEKYLLRDWGIGAVSCGNYVYLNTSEATAGERLQLTVEDTVTIDVPGIDDVVHGIPVWRYEVGPFPLDEAPSPFTVLAAKQVDFGLTLDGSGRCPNKGFDASLIWVLVDPTMSNAFEAWVLRQGYEIAPPPPDDGRYLNTWLIDVPAGSEDAAIAAMREQDWFIDAKRHSTPAGPEDVFVDFPGEEIFGGAATQQTARRILSDALGGVFGDAFDPVELVSRRGARFNWEFLRPVPEMLPEDSRFGGRWLKADLRFTFTPQFEGAWRLLIQAADGWLPRWDRAEPPPLEHVAQSHLSKFGSDDLRNYAVLVAIQNRIATELADGWDGEAYTEDY